jgi:hypothetical protein
MSRTCYISFKTEDAAYKERIQQLDGIALIDRSLNEAIESTNADYILRRIREDYLADSTVTIHLIGSRSAEWLGPVEQQFIKRELQASLYDGAGNTRNGILGVVLPEAQAAIYGGTVPCGCGLTLGVRTVDDRTVVKEFSANYFIPNGSCHWADEDRYCVMVTWNEFLSDPASAIEEAYLKRTAPIAQKVRVFPT